MAQSNTRRVIPPFPFGFVLCAALCILSLVAGTAAAEAATAIRFSLDRKMDGSLTPFAVAQVRGMYRGEGLDVTTDAAAGSPESLERVASGERDVALVDLNTLIRYRDRPNTASVQAVYVIHSRAAYAITGRKSRGVTTIASLPGRTIGVAEGDLAILAWPGLARRNGVDPSKVKLEKIGSAVREPMLSAGQVDAVSGLSFGSGLNVRDRGVPSSDLTVLKFSELGSQLYGLAVVVNPAFASANPDAVKGFLRAITTAIKFSIKEPARATDDMLTIMDSGARDLELERLRLVLHDNIVTDDVKRHGLGTVDAVQFEKAVDQLAEDTKFRARPELPAIFNDSFLPAPALRKLN